MKAKKEILIHLIFWLVYIANSALTYPEYYIENYGFWNIVWKQFTGNLVWMVPFYLNYSLLVPRLLSKQKNLGFVISCIGVIPLTIGLGILHSIYLDYFFSSGDFFYQEKLKYIPYYGLQVFFYLVISTGAKFTLDWFKNQKIIEALEKEKKASELALLKFQLNPHFLFNTLNNIYSLINQNSSKASDAILKLSDIMRYMLKENNNDTVPLKSEIEYLESFIDLQKMRLSKPQSVSFDYHSDNSVKYISPMILIPFVENAFKHGDLSGGDSKIEINLSISDQKIVYLVKNRILKAQKDSSSGIGMPQLRRRLELIYPKDFKLDYSTNENNFEAIMELNFK